ncbi:LEAF RUST 10 DISEASE-RESISTANCE LOCUS RECEPTOR-LIKE PROTEIN KINASE-like 1.1 [Arachis duranensis]|uniref:LEAF RUST 10 DISEASE-RESISTANCE LOCUS RECEPTOR-LIKE PROTEIN KINASE-like 1.1 n=1 Tax=Arachis duranensis TaxID=130453 RepID=A0A6P4DEZ3_ARADU|nr:LEAF RUST 10 DISEASE-RESISTANCE LOCUS RECEPTOR-LIKE PROTEIN KINASE-like 1.1 [Arachis duranensis]
MGVGHSFLGFFLLLCCFGLLHSAPNKKTDEGKSRYSAPPFECGKFGKLWYPFTNTSCSECGLHVSNCDNPGADVQVFLRNQTYKLESIAWKDNFSAIIFIQETGAAVNLWELRGDLSLRVVNRVAFFKCTHEYHPEDHGIFHYERCHSTNYDVYFGSDHSFPSDSMYGDRMFPSLLNACSDDTSETQEQPNSTQQCTSFKSFVIIEVASADPLYSYWPVTRTTGKTGASKAAILGLSTGLAAMIIVATCQLCAILLLYKRRHNSSGGYGGKLRNLYSRPNSNTNPESGNLYFGIPLFSYEELQVATNNFDQTKELGEGGFGTVYYGKLRDGREVAVKRLFERNYKPVESFINEIQILTRLRHRNLVSLYGCTSRHSRELLLVYEYIPNGTLSYHLRGDRTKSSTLTWPVRMKIAIETACALAYLHACGIIHRDVKTSNILLDNNFGVKVADFGLSRLFPSDVTHVSTAPRGTPGYVDPDYRLCYQLTNKSDVYSFGVVLVELISSLPAVDMNRERDDVKLANVAVRKFQKGAFCELVDPSLGIQSDDDSRRMIISVAKLAFYRGSAPWRFAGLCGSSKFFDQQHPAPSPNILMEWITRLLVNHYSMFANR